MPLDTQTLGARALDHLRLVVAIDSQSDERSETIPSTVGQRRLSERLATFFRELGFEVTVDGFANLIAHAPGRGAGKDASPLALMVHLDTARGTRAHEQLHVVSDWPGDRIPFPYNATLCADVETYPDLKDFVGHQVVHGDGDAPFGLDDKLGLTHLMSLATLLAEHPELDHPPLYLIGRPDEEIGRMEAVEGLAGWLAEQGVTSAYTIDGILPFEVNVENFNAAGASVTFPFGAEASSTRRVKVVVGGVNTHGCTAKAEGHRGAPRLAAEIWQALADEGQIRALGFRSNSLRDCDGVLLLGYETASERATIERVVRGVVEPHFRRGASLGFVDGEESPDPVKNASATEAMLRFVHDFYVSAGPQPRGAEDSEGRQGYSAPYRAHARSEHVTLDIRLRDFEPDGLDARKQHVLDLAAAHGATAEVHDQYVNMGPRMATRRDLVDLATEAGRAIGVDCHERPIRGGTGVDSFLDRGVFVANLGTGYFAPESEKELTSVELMADHARWLVALVEAAATR